jgi:hypothetical protein
MAPHERRPNAAQPGSFAALINALIVCSFTMRASGTIVQFWIRGQQPILHLDEGRARAA